MLPRAMPANLFGLVQDSVSRLQVNVNQQLSAWRPGHLSPTEQLHHDDNSASCGLQSTFVRQPPSLFMECGATGGFVVQRRRSELDQDQAELLTGLDGVSLLIASFLDATSLGHVQQVNRAWYAFVAQYRDVLFGALLSKDFGVTITSSTPFKSYMFSLRHEVEKELLHTQAIEPLHAALEHYCTHTEPTNHGFVAMFCDIIYFKDPRIARFVAQKRQSALSMVLTSTPDHVMAFRKKSGYNRPVTFVPVNNPHWPDFVLPPVDAPGFLGYAFDHVEVVPGYESLKDTVIKSILKELMVFDTHANATAYGLMVERTPYTAVLEEDEVDPNDHLTFSSPLRRQLLKYPIHQRAQILQRKLDSIDQCITTA
ncbi:TPA: hypothetical protein N0F65_007552 [Lagenidium giganteum]|uniref:Uncharacterized protein n=1 Tax=Lagenidium giganteum TaxID=4803 RepID=A0AAV2ZSP4_9STRA|nr:TPA: hypothetical protein N0F65_007552 [Lagenidium giganteum]